MELPATMAVKRKAHDAPETGRPAKKKKLLAGSKKPIESGVLTQQQLYRQAIASAAPFHEQLAKRRSFTRTAEERLAATAPRRELAAMIKAINEQKKNERPGRRSRSFKITKKRAGHRARGWHPPQVAPISVLGAQDTDNTEGEETEEAPLPVIETPRANKTPQAEEPATKTANTNNTGRRETEEAPMPVITSPRAIGTKRKATKTPLADEPASKKAKDNQALATASVTQLATQPSPPVSGLESLPTEILWAIDDMAENPWLGYTCRSLYMLLEKQDNDRAVARRQEFVNKAFDDTFSPQERAALFAAQPDSRGMIAGLQPYADKFSQFVDLPWFCKAVFGENAMIERSSLQLWFDKAAANHAIYAQPGWTQARGDFLVALLNAVGNGQMKKRIPSNKYQKVYGHVCASNGLRHALDEGCVPALQVIQRLSELDPKACDDESEQYARDFVGKYAPWSKPWTIAPSWRALLAMPPVDDIMERQLTAVFQAMEETEVGEVQAKFPKISREYVRCFWHIHTWVPSMADFLRCFTGPSDLRHLAGIMRHSGRKAGSFDDIIVDKVLKSGRQIAP